MEDDEINTNPKKYHISEYDTVSLYSFGQKFVIEHVIMCFVDVKLHGVYLSNIPEQVYFTRYPLYILYYLKKTNSDNYFIGSHDNFLYNT